MGGQTGQEPEQGRRDPVQVHVADLAAAEQDIDELATQHGRKPGNRDHREEQQAERPCQESREFDLTADRRIARQRRQEDDPKWDADDPDRDLEEGERDVEVGHGAHRKCGRQGGDDDEGDLARPQPEGSRHHQQKRAPCLRIIPVDPRFVAEAEPAEGSYLDEEMAERPDDHAQGKTFDPERGCQEQCAADDRQVVDDRRDRRRGEPAAGVEDAGSNGAHCQKDRAEEHDPGEDDRALELLAFETRGNRLHHHRGEQEEHAGQDGQGNQHQVDDRRDDSPRVSLFIALEECRNDRNQGRRQGPAATSWKIRSGIRKAAKNVSS